ncbi:MAG: SWIM zinc finger family protein [Bacillota bacterium]|nr:SWIM zinc finger family protein [Bacillota bacterium]
MRRVGGGIKARAARGKQGRNWWAERWQDVLASICSSSRLARGKAYARSGHVLSIDIQEGLVLAKVQGSRARPYSVQIEVPTLSEKDWHRLARVLSERAVFAAKLLAGQMPPQIEEAFAQAGLSLFPRAYAKPKMKAVCSCPDWENPCKHVAAVYWLLGEEFDRDPCLLLRLRGMSRAALVGLVGEAGSGTAQAASASAVSESAATSLAPLLEDVVPVEPLPRDRDRFWRGGADRSGAITGHGAAAAWPARSAETMLSLLGAPRFWRGSARVDEALLAAYEAAADLALSLLARGEASGDENIGNGDDPEGN